MNNKSQKYGHQNCRRIEYYYEALKIDVNTSDYYMFSSVSRLDTFGYLYKYSFNPYNSENILLSYRDNSCQDKQFTILAYLQSNITYVLLVTTSYDHMNVQGPFSVIVDGPNRIHMKRISMYVLDCNLSYSRNERKRHTVKYQCDFQ